MPIRAREDNVINYTIRICLKNVVWNSEVFVIFEHWLGLVSGPRMIAMEGKEGGIMIGTCLYLLSILMLYTKLFKIPFQHVFFCVIIPLFRIGECI